MRSIKFVWCTQCLLYFVLCTETQRSKNKLFSSLQPPFVRDARLRYYVQFNRKLVQDILSFSVIIRRPAIHFFFFSSVRIKIREQRVQQNINLFHSHLVRRLEIVDPLPTCDSFWTVGAACHSTAIHAESNVELGNLPRRHS